MKQKNTIAVLSLLLLLSFFVACSNENTTESTTNTDGQTNMLVDAVVNTNDGSGVAESNVKIVAISEKETADLSEDDLPSQYFFMGPTYGMGENPSYSTLFAEPDGLERLKNFYADLTKDFSYVEVHVQFLAHEGYYYGDAKFSDNELVNEEVNGSFHTKLQTFMVGKSVYTMLDNKIATGTNFEDDDFVVYSDTDVIPLILGAEYNGLYSLGDELTLSLHNQPLQFSVIGFLQADTTIAMNTPEISLDTRIIMPFFDVAYEPTSEENVFFQQVYYTQKTQGFLQLDNTIESEELFQEVKALADKCDLFYAVTPIATTLDFGM